MDLKNNEYLKFPVWALEDAVNSLLSEYTLGQTPNDDLYKALHAKSQADGNNRIVLAWWQNIIDEDPLLAPLAWQTVYVRHKLLAIRLLKNLMKSHRKNPITIRGRVNAEDALISFSRDPEIANTRNPEIRRAWKEIIESLSPPEAEYLAEYLTMGDRENTCEIINDLEEHARFSRSKGKNDGSGDP